MVTSVEVFYNCEDLSSEFKICILLWKENLQNWINGDQSLRFESNGRVCQRLEEQLVNYDVHQSDVFLNISNCVDGIDSWCCCIHEFVINGISICIDTQEQRLVLEHRISIIKIPFNQTDYRINNFKLWWFQYTLVVEEGVLSPKIVSVN